MRRYLPIDSLQAQIQKTLFSRHSTWSNRYGYKVALSLSRSERRRQEAIFEFIESWQSYTFQLHRLLHMFFLPLEKREGILNDFRDWFSGLQAIYKHAQYSNEILQQIRSQVVYSISEVVQCIVCSLPIESYLSFCRDLQRITDVLRERGSHSGSHVEQLAQSFAVEHDPLGVYSSMCLPFQRLLKIQLLIGAIIKNTSERHYDKPKLVDTQTLHCDKLTFLNTQMQQSGAKNVPWWHFW